MVHLGMLHNAIPLSSNRSRGFSLVELMIAIAIIGILLALAVPNFLGLIASSRLSSSTSDLTSAIAEARSNAIKTGSRVTLCKSSNGTSCASSGTWEQGWISFIDKTKSGTTAAVDVGDTILTKNPAMPAGIVVNGNMPYISFGADGMPKSMDGGLLPGTVRVCSTSSALNNDNRTRDLVMNSVGRIAVNKTTGISASCPSI